jgi:hypothetical protein
VVGALLLVAVLALEGDDVDLPPRAPRSPVGCLDAVRAGGAKFSPWRLRPTPLHKARCEAPDGVALRRGGGGLRFQPAANVNCAFALRLARFEEILHEEAKSILGSPVRAVVQLGTYSCRRMAAYPDLVSEHSFANAIDIHTFVLRKGKSVVVERDWVRADQPATTPAAKFLRRLTRRLYDEKIFSVVLTPSYDKHHKNHLHLDGAAYSVDGT